jgi:hypothetical protein
MPATKDAAWWRDYRARKRAATQNPSDGGGTALSVDSGSTPEVPLPPPSRPRTPRKRAQTAKNVAETTNIAENAAPIFDNGVDRSLASIGPSRSKRRTTSVPPGSPDNDLLPAGGDNPVRPSFLAAPDDDCLACEHDRQAYHLDGRCTFPVGRRQQCGCPGFVAAF